MKTALRTITLALAALATSVSLPAFAREPAAAPVAVQASAETASEPVHARPALWKVSDEDTTIYMFGTIHVLPEGIKWFEGEVASAFAQSDMLVTEIVGDDEATMRSLVIAKAMLPPDQSLNAQLTEDDRVALAAALKRYNVPAAMFDRFEPWYVAVALSTLPLMQEGFNTENGVESRLEARAKERQIGHEGLETTEYQLNLFDGLPVEVQKSYLSEVLEQLPTIRTELMAMVEAWKQGDSDKLAKLMNVEESNPVLVKTLLVDRNKAWATWVQSRLARPGTVFMAVGAGHLGGPGSVQDQLAARAVPFERVQ